MENKHGRKLIIYFTIASLVIGLPFTQALASEDELTVQVLLDPYKIKNENEVALWLAYILSRANYIDAHKGYYRKQKGTIVPCFEEEIKAREDAAEVYLELKAEDKSLNSLYFEDLVKIKKSGFLPEYIWSYFSQSTWENPPSQDRMSLFETWMAKNLRSHKPETYGSIVIE